MPRRAGELDTTIGQFKAQAAALSAVGPSPGTRAEPEPSNVGASASGGGQSAAVWQCSACREILADTTSYVCDIPELKVVCVSTAGGVRAAQEMSVSSVGFDKGSAFNMALCTRCSTPVGKVYRTTSGRMDAARDAVCLNTGSVTLYALGSAGEAPRTAEDLGIASVLARLQDNEATVASLQETCSFLREQVSKLQAMLLVMHEGQGHGDGAAHGQPSASPRPTVARSPSGAIPSLASLASPPSPEPKVGSATVRSGAKRRRRITLEQLS